MDLIELPFKLSCGDGKMGCDDLSAQERREERLPQEEGILYCLGEGTTQFGPCRFESSKNSQELVHRKSRGPNESAQSSR